jgi:hypothetical protein
MACGRCASMPFSFSQIKMPRMTSPEACLGLLARSSVSQATAGGGSVRYPSTRAGVERQWVEPPPTLHLIPRLPSPFAHRPTFARLVVCLWPRGFPALRGPCVPAIVLASRFCFVLRGLKAPRSTRSRKQIGAGAEAVEAIRSRLSAARSQQPDPFAIESQEAGAFQGIE